MLYGSHIPMHYYWWKNCQKPTKHWDEDKKKTSIEAKAMNILFCELNVEEFNRMYVCSNIKEVCDTLKVTNEGTN